MTIAITGATGQLGRLVIQGMGQRRPNQKLLALARHPDKAADLGIEVRAADYDRPDTLERALAGADTLLLISSSEIGHRLRQHRNVVHAAKQAGIGHIVYTSLLRADSSPLNLATEHAVTEADIENSGIAYTLLRNGWYTENHTDSIPSALAAGAVIGSAGNGRIASAARADYAEAAIAVLTGPGHQGKVYELAGDNAWTLADLAAEISRQSGRDIPYRDLPEAQYAAALEAAGLPASLAEDIASWDDAASQDALFDDQRQLAALIGRPTTPMATSVAEALKRA